MASINGSVAPCVAILITIESIYMLVIASYTMTTTEVVHIIADVVHIIAEMVVANTSERSALCSES